MKTPAQWLEDLSGNLAVIRRYLTEADIAAIQADALSGHFAAALWEDDEFVVTFNGKPLGSSMDKAQAEAVASWLNAAMKEAAKPKT